MSLDAKSLKKLAKACRDSGIKHYKCADFEFTLTDDLPEPKSHKKTLVSTTGIMNDPFESDTLTQDQLLMWSAGDPTDTSKSDV